MKIRQLTLALWLISLFFCTDISLFAQKNVVIVTENQEVLHLAEALKLTQKKFKTLRHLERKLARYVAECQALGYLTLSVDTVFEDSTSFKVHLFAGGKYSQTAIAVDSAAQLLLEKARLHSALEDGNLPLERFSATSEALLHFFENHGFPFTEVFLQDVDIQQDTISAVLRIEPHQYIVFDSIVWKGNAKVRNSYLYPYLNWRRKRAYNEAVVAAVPQRMRELPFVTETRPAGVEFVDDKAVLYLFIDKKKTNQFDGYLGIVPVDERTGKVGIAGELNLTLRNIFGIGEGFDLLWRSPKPKSQFLNVNVDFPYLFRTALGVNFNFLLDKTDTTYLSMNYLLGLKYSLLGNSALTLYFDYTTSDLLTANALSADAANLSHADFRKTMYGLQFRFRRLDFLYNPRKGVDLMVDAAVGQRRILQNAQADSLLYKDVALRSVHWRFSAQIQGYVPLHKRWVLVLGVRGGALFGAQNLANELFKFGGMNTLRGFDEDAIAASSFAIFNAEVRFLFAKIAYFNLFGNVSWYEQRLGNQYVSDFPYGFGVGLAFETKPGIFFVSYALGSQQGNPLSFRTGKIHFGMALTF